MTQSLPSSAPMPATRSFTNPIVHQDAGDPWVIQQSGWYYFTATLEPEGGLWVWKSRTLTGLEGGEKVRVWTAPSSGPRSAQIWAPELHFLRGLDGKKRWHLYYTASDGLDANHRHYVLEADSPLGPYRDLGLVHPEHDHYAIDGSVLELPDGQLFWMYADDGLNIAPMASPARATGPGVRFAQGTQDWERAWVKNGPLWEKANFYWIEAPEALLHDGRIFVVYSAGHTAAEYYLGLLELVGPDPLDPRSWKKHPDAVFGPYASKGGAVYSPGHNSFTKSPDGVEDWLVYHAKDSDADDFAGRTVRAQPFKWNADGTPYFGHPFPSGVALERPSGE